MTLMLMPPPKEKDFCISPPVITSYHVYNISEPTTVTTPGPELLSGTRNEPENSCGNADSSRQRSQSVC
jgi:hypothetical protein